MERIAFISGDGFVYWSAIVLALAAVAAAAIYAAFYLNKSRNFLAMGLSVLLSAALAVPMARLVHWYCQHIQYPSFQEAMTDYTTGGGGSFLGAKFSYFSADEHTFMGFGGIRYMEVNYTDAEWADFVAANNNDLSAEYKKSE